MFDFHNVNFLFHKFYRIGGFYYFHFIFKWMFDDWWLSSNHLLVLGNYIEDIHLFWLHPRHLHFPKYRMLRGVNCCEFFLLRALVLKNPQNCTYDEDFCMILLHELAIVHPNVIKTLKIVFCSSRDDVPSKWPKKMCRPDSLDSTPFNQSNWSGRGRFYAR